MLTVTNATCDRKQYQVAVLPHFSSRSAWRYSETYFGIYVVVPSIGLVLLRRPCRRGLGGFSLPFQQSAHNYTALVRFFNPFLAWFSLRFSFLFSFSFLCSFSFVCSFSFLRSFSFLCSFSLSFSFSFSLSFSFCASFFFSFSCSTLPRKARRTSCLPPKTPCFRVSTSVLRSSPASQGHTRSRCKSSSTTRDSDIRRITTSCGFPKIVSCMLFVGGETGEARGRGCNHIMHGHSS